MTITEKILAAAAGRPSVKPNEIVVANVDLAMMHDALGPIVYKQFRELNIPVWDPEKVFPVVDHNCLPGNIIENAQIIMETERFAADYHIPNLYDMRGVAHQIVIECGKFLPGMVAVGTDSHTCTYGALGAFSTGIGSTEMCAVLADGSLWFKIPETIKITISGDLSHNVMSKDIMLSILHTIGTNGAIYKTLEFTGDTIDRMTMSSRFTLCNMAIEAGAKNGIIAPDDTTIAYLKSIGADLSKARLYRSDDDAVYADELTLDISHLEPQVAVPFSPANGVPVSKVAGTHLDQVIIGGCTNGRTEDIAKAAEIIRGKTIPRNMKCFVVPASNRVYAEVARLGYLSDLADAGCTIVNPGCGGCGAQMPLAAGQACLGTHNRNFRGRMGSPDSFVYLASPATAAASALNGCITDPRNY